MTPTDADGVAIRTFDLTKRYGALRAVDGLNLVVPKGSVFGLIGPNGAGKTTTFAILAGLLQPSTGRAIVDGHDTQGAPYKVKASLGYMPDSLGVYDDLRVDEYLHFFAGAYRVPRRTRPALIDSLLELVDLTAKRRSMVNALSRGMKQRLSLARSLVHDPAILVLDEPASGLDPRARVELRELINELHSMGKTVVISSHILADLQEICTDIGIIEAGRLLASGSPTSILESIGASRQIRVWFLGGESEDFNVVDDVGQRDLLRRLVIQEGRDVVEFKMIGGGLEDVFMQVTEGKVQ